MAVTVPHTAENVTPRSPDFWGRHRIATVEYTFDDEYATGGTAFTPNEVGLSEFENVLISPDAASDAVGYSFAYDYTAQKIVVLVEEAVAAGGPLVEVANATDLSGVVVRITAIGI